jgi:DNA-binding beta-propeller fold protein YncE
MKTGTVLSTLLILAAAGPAHAHPPYGIAADGEGSVFLLDWPVKHVVKVTAKGEASVFADFARRSPDSHPHALAVGPDGALYVAETYGARMWRVAADGTVAEHSPVSKEKPLPAGDWLNLRFGPAGNLHLVLAGRDRSYRIVRIAKDGSWSELFSCRRGEKKHLDLYGAGLAVGKGGTVYLACRGKVLVLSKEGRFETLVEKGVGSPWGIVAHPDGGVVVADERGGRVLRVTGKGEVSELARGFERPYAVTRDRDGRYLVAEELSSDKYRLRRISPKGEVSTVAVIDAG